MSTIFVSNLTRLTLGLPSPIGNIPALGSVRKEITTSQLENARSSLVSLELNGSITFNVSVEGTSSELDTDFMTAEDTEQLVASNPAAILHTTTGPTNLTIGAWADGQALRRTGTTAVGYDIVDRSGPRIIVGNALQGDTLAVCDYLDAGDGVQLQAALTAAGALSPDADVYVRSGNYTLATPINIPSLVTMRCSGWGTIFLVTSTQRKAFIVSSSASMEDVSISVPVPALGAVGTEVVECGTGTWFKRCRIVMTAQTAGQAANESLRFGFRTTTASGVNMVYGFVQGISFRELGIAQDFVNFYIESNVAAQHGAISHTRSQSGDYGYDLRGCVELTNWYANTPGVAAIRLTSNSGTTRVSPRVSTGYARILHTAGLTKFGVIFDTGADASGALCASVENSHFYTTSTTVTSTGLSFTGLGTGNSAINCSFDGFPLGVTIAVGQASVTVSGYLRGFTTAYTDSSTGTTGQNNMRNL